MFAPSPQELVERALEASTSSHCVAIVRVGSSANLRWANNTLTTNGAMRGRSVSVVSVVGESVGVRSASVVDSLEDLVRASEQAARPATSPSPPSRRRPPC